MKYLWMVLTVIFQSFRLVRFHPLRAFFGPMRGWFPKKDDRFAELAVHRGFRSAARVLWLLLVSPLPWRYLPEQRPWMRLLPRWLFLRECVTRDLVCPDGVQNPREQWLLINGAFTMDAVLERNIDYIQHLFRRDLRLIRNPTNGILLDYCEIVFPRLFGHIRPTIDTTRRELERCLRDEQIERVVVIAHSEGTIIITKALAALTEQSQDEPAVDLSKLELYLFADCTRDWHELDFTRSSVHIEHFANQYDAPAATGMLAADVHPPGKIYVRQGVWGHMLNMHYLSAFDSRHPRYDAEAYPGSRLWGEITRED
jgi:hypothetical protein